MSRRVGAQLNIRSDFARARAQELAAQTGMTTAQVVEEALRAYTPPAEARPVGGLVRAGPLLVMPARARRISLEAANAALDAAREREG
jgi:hypothetical protein